MSSVVFSGTGEQYFAYVADENARERRAREDRARAEYDPALQCEHNVSLYRTCQPCAPAIDGRA